MKGICIVALPAGNGRVTYTDGGSAPLHQTLVYLGDTKTVKLTPGQKDELRSAGRLLSMQQPFTAKVVGVATLGEGRDRVVLTEAPRLQIMHDRLMRNELVAMLHSQYNSHPSWISHITTDSHEHGDTILFDRIGVWIGEDRTEYVMGDSIAKRKYVGANPKSSPKEIVGSHGHRPHGPSILWPALYEHLKAKGMTKQKAAMISNGMWRRKHKLPPKSVPGTKGRVGVNKSTVLARAWDIVLDAESEATHPGGR